LIRTEIEEIKGLEKSFMQRKVELAKEKKTEISQDEEIISRTILALEEAKTKNQNLCEEIENLKKNEQIRKEHELNMRFIEENLKVIEKLAEFSIDFPYFINKMNKC